MNRPALSGVVAGLVSLGVYLATMPPTIVEGDGGELVSAARVLGIPHPTGYPLYMLLARLFLFLPFSDPAVRVTLLSACAAAGAAGLVAWSAASLTKSRAAGLLAGLVTGLNRPLWSQATEVEVYALNAFLLSLALAAFVRWRARRDARDVVWLALLTGLGLAHHRTSLFFTAPLLVAAAFLTPRLDRRTLRWAVAALALPLLLYLYLPIRAAASPAVMWADTSRWGEFLTHVAGSQYRKYIFARPLGPALGLGAKIGAQFGVELTLVGTALVITGLLSLFRRERALSWALLCATGTLTVWNLGYDVSDVVDFFVPCWMVLGLWAAEGLSVTTRSLARVVTSRLAWAPVVVAGAVLLLVPANLVQRDWSRCDRHNRWRDYDAGRLLLAQIPPRGLYVTGIDDFLAMYLQQVEGARPDVTILRPIGVSLAGRTITDAELARAMAGPVARFEQRVAGGPSHAQYEHATVEFAADLSDAVGPQRPVFCHSGSLVPPFDLPVQAVSESLYRVVRHRALSLAPLPEQDPVAELTPAISLARCALRPGRARPGDVVRVQLDWRCTSAVTAPMLLQLRLIPPGLPLGGATDWDYLLDRQAWFASGQLPLAATPAGSAYRQEVTLLVPTNGPAGRWLLLAALLPKGGRAEFHEIGALAVTG